jgi:hypothetical protein
MELIETITKLNIENSEYIKQKNFLNIREKIIIIYNFLIYFG